MPGRKRDDQIAMKRSPTRSPSRSGRHSSSRAKAATARSISPASRTLIGLTSTPSDGATAWIAPHWPMPAAIGGITKHRRARHARRDLLEQLQPFTAEAVLELVKPVVLPPGRARLSTKPAPTGSGTFANTIGTVRVACSNGASGAGASGQDDVRRERDQFRRISRDRVGIAAAPAIFDPHVAADGPAQLLQPLQERSDAGLRFGIVRGQVREHADAPHSLGLLRPRRERPRRRRTAEQRDELATFHVAPLPVRSRLPPAKTPANLAEVLGADLNRSKSGVGSPIQKASGGIKDFPRERRHSASEAPALWSVQEQAPWTRCSSSYWL